MADDEESREVAEIVTKLSPRTVKETTSRLVEILRSRGIRIFDVIDQSMEARDAGLELRETTLVIFGSPSAGTPVMVASPLMALDLPLKVLIWADGTQTKVSYYSPRALAARHGLEDRLAANLDAIDGLTDALTIA